MLDFIIIGAQKSASTTLHRSLAQHPLIYMPSEESRFFETPDYERDGLTCLQNVISRGQGRVTGIKRPDYLARPEVPERIFLHAPHARLLVTLRHPVKRAVSSYFHLAKLGFVPIKPVNEGFHAILDGLWQNTFPKSREILEYGLYAKHLTRYLEVFPKNQILVLTDSQLHATPELALAETLAHLGLPTDWRPGQFRHRSNQGVYSRLRLLFINLRNRAVFNYNKDRTRLDRRPGILGPFFNTLVIGTDRLVLKHFFDNRIPPLEADIERRLLDFYREDTGQLELMLQCDLSDWKKA